MLTLTYHQNGGATLLAENIKPGEVVRFDAPTGMGKTIVLAHAMKGKRVLFVSKVPELVFQFDRIANEVELSGGSTFPRHLQRYPEIASTVDVVIFGEDMNSDKRVNDMEREALSRGCAVVHS